MKSNLFRSNSSLIIVVILLAVMPLIASDIYFPVMPQIALSFQASSASVKASLTVFLLGLAIGQVVYGFLSDTFGRKKILLVGMAIYLIATVFCIFASSIWLLNLSRLLQGLGVCSASVMARAIVADRFDAQQSAAVFAIVFSCVGLSPALGPVIGGVITTYLNWRYTFIFLAGVGIVLYLLIIVKLNDYPVKKTQFGFVHYLANCMEILSTKKFIFYTIFSTGAFLAWYTFITESAFIFQAHNFTVFETGLMYSPLAICYIIANIIARKVVSNTNIDTGIKIGLIFYSIGVLVLLANALTSNLLIILLAGLLFIVFANGFLLSLGSAGALASIRAIKGSGSAILGCVQLGSSALGSLYIGIFSSETHLMFILLLLAYTALMLFCYRKLKC